MKAYRLVSQGQMQFQEVPKPAPAAGEALLRVLACGVCGTDIHLKNSGHYEWLGNPITLGHEICARVESLPESKGDKETTHHPPLPPLQVGDQVVVDPQIVCGRCFYCQRGRYNLCENLQHLGIAIGGGFQEYLTVPLQNLHPIRSDLPPAMAALAEPVATTVAAMKLASPTPEDRIAIVGLGFFGQLFLQLARLWGVEQVIGFDPALERRQIALQRGATAALDPSDPEVDSQLLSLTKGRGASIVLDAAGSSSAPADCIRFAGKMGRIIVFGHLGSPVTLPWYEILVKELTVIGSKSSNHAWELSVRLLEQQKLDLEPLIRTYSFGDAPRAFEAAESRQILKGVLVF